MKQRKAKSSLALKPDMFKKKPDQDCPTARAKSKQRKRDIVNKNIENLISFKCDETDNIFFTHSFLS